MFAKVLIANRGEIACRIARTLKKMRIRSLAVYSAADSQARHVQEADEAYYLGPAPARESYLKIERILEVAQAQGAEAIHPGYGFLSENAEFARRCQEAGLVFIGPTPEAIAAMGSKSQAKALMQRKGVPVVPGYHGEDQNPLRLQAEADRIGYPLLIKATAGGGGKGMRVVKNTEDFPEKLAAAQREAFNAFGDAEVLLERYLERPHHIEFQVFGDTHGQIVHLFERECSVQRRHQKIFEETPSPFIGPDLREAMGRAAVKAAQAIGYVGAGTVEFIVGEDREFFFMEMNTRLQVEHPVTEQITGLDLVEWQVRVAAGEPLPLAQEQVKPQGHALEVRIYAETPENGFLPSTGTLTTWHEPAPKASVRVDSGVRSGDEISIYYDPMLAKLITWGENRAEALRSLQEALGETAALGVGTNLGFLQRLAAHPAFQAGEIDTGFIERHFAALFPPSCLPPALVLQVAAIYFIEIEKKQFLSLDKTHHDPYSPWNLPSGWRLGGQEPWRIRLQDAQGLECEVLIEASEEGYRALTPEASFLRLSPLGTHWQVQTPQGLEPFGIWAHGPTIQITRGSERFYLKRQPRLAAAGAHTEEAGQLHAPMPGKITRLFVNEGDVVHKGQPLLILEAMKMEHPITAPHEGVIEKILYRLGELAPAEATLLILGVPPEAT